MFIEMSLLKDSFLRQSEKLALTKEGPRKTAVSINISCLQNEDRIASTISWELIKLQTVRTEFD